MMKHSRSADRPTPSTDARARARRIRASRPALVTLLLLAGAMAGCLDDDRPTLVGPDAGPLFARYVALGNSLTAGFQSGGINVELQREAYPVLLAEMAGAEFGIPAISMPGCPPPLATPLGPRISDQPCGTFPRVPTPPRLVQNLAVPGADTEDVTDPIGTGTILNTIILGGRTQVSAMIDADPTLVSVWIGNNDVLSAALSGDLSRMTPVADFEAEYAEIVAAIQSTDAEDAILIGVANAAIIAPVLQPAAYFWAVAQALPAGLPAFDVSDNCAPFTPTGAVNPTAFIRLVSFLGVLAQIQAGTVPVRIDCAADAPFVLNFQEQNALADRIGTYNAYIREQAEENDWIYVDPGDWYSMVLGDPNNVRKCQLLSRATDLQSFTAAVLTTCPVDLDPTNDVSFYGDYFSLDGVHPSLAAQTVIANTLAERLNEKHGLDLPVTP